MCKHAVTFGKIQCQGGVKDIYTPLQQQYVHVRCQLWTCHSTCHLVHVRIHSEALSVSEKFANWNPFRQHWKHSAGPDKYGWLHEFQLFVTRWKAAHVHTWKGKPLPHLHWACSATWAPLVAKTEVWFMERSAVEVQNTQMSCRKMVQMHDKLHILQWGFRNFQHCTHLCAGMKWTADSFDSSWRFSQSCHAKCMEGLRPCGSSRKVRRAIIKWCRMWRSFIDILSRY